MEEKLDSIQDTIPEQDEAAVDAAANEQEALKVDNETNVDTEEESAEQDGENKEFVLPIKFNKENINLNRDEAITYAQMGKKDEQISEEYSFYRKKEYSYAFDAWS